MRATTRGCKAKKRGQTVAKVVGIDLGTTNSCVAVVEAGDPKVLPNAEGGRTTPSVVGISKDGERLVGQPAKRQAVLNPDRTVTSIKRRIGTRDKTTIDGKDYSPEEISSMILRKLRDDAADYLGEDVNQAVITVPAYFDDDQRTATKQAGEVAGLEVMRIINEPTAAALAYGHQMQELEGTIMVYDLRGGTFDVSIMDVEVDKSNTEERDYFEVRATSGDTALGGDDFDQRVMDWMAEDFKKDVGIDLREDRQALQRLREAAEKAKIELSSAIQTQISLPFITSVEGEGPKHLEMTLTRAKFEELIRDLVDKTKDSVEKAMTDAGVGPGDLTDVILVGGSTRIPMVQKLVAEIAGKEPRKGINPDEVVAVGAAIQAAVLGDEMQDMVLVDVTPLSLGIETLGDVYDVLIERNTSIPTKVQRTYTTASDNQSTVEVHVLQGERKKASQNKSLGRFHLTGIPPAPRGVPQIEVTFDIDANGILNVSARDKATGREQDITITGSGQLEEEEVERMVHEAEEHAEEDQKFAEVAQLRNTADQLAHQLNSTLEEMGDQVSEADRNTIQQKIEAMQEAAKGDDPSAIQAAIDDAQNEFAKISQEAYERASAAEAGQQAGPQAGPQTGGPEPGAEPETDEDVIDAEFEAEDEE